MAASNVTPGRRVRDRHAYEFEPTDYGVTPNGEKYGCTPNGLLAHLSNHTVTEHDDGTFTVSPSIAVRGGGGKTWHGFLEHGVWREA